MLIPLTQKHKREVQKIFKELVAKAGSQQQLAKMLHIAEPSVSNLVHGKNMPSARVCVLIEQHFEIKKEDLRPDMFMIN